ncbi:beta-ketoacyl synthase [Chitinophaga sedimenti]|uniref:beta-ketoacyl-[acyl-carrier-protein] synthase family protein n=1 Tax=Chitinophaga sedimenti TaxID=2033606 RepID=UPI00200529CD|nr:beta-ketoacyl synthase N-terminal-like domain-containing protein [Chitinophaga sedimenti]MCK7560107.1 beta-ketoacyl synthase [Chitinophaga sedimenti]
MTRSAAAIAAFVGTAIPPWRLRFLWGVDRRGQLASFNGSGYTKFEQLCVLSIQNALSQTSIPVGDQRTAFILSTTKGNIERIADKTAPPSALQLFPAAQKIAAHVGITTQPLVISNACISGLLALIVGQRLIRSGQYDQVIVTGADVFTQFVLSGFQSFLAVSNEPCRPFDAARNGISLGEAAATVILTADERLSRGIVLGEGASSNDANHISGPSRTGEELAGAVLKAIQLSKLTTNDIGFVSAHGTATLYNDEMEAKAFNFAGLQETPVNSLKGYYGHTLGAAGLVEAIIGMQALQQDVVLPTKGYSEHGVPVPLNVSHGEPQTRNMRHFLKTTSGFGGCNAAMVFSKTGNMSTLNRT